jgi:23S rRNA pseudouridine1911/1915/1917 synthase
VNENPNTIRLTKAVQKKFPQYSLAQIESLIAKGLVLVNGKTRKKKGFVSESDNIALVTQGLQSALSPNSNVNCRLITEDKDFLFLEKAPFVHSVAHDFDEMNSVANWLLSLNPGLADLDPLECGLAHRLDFETSGVMVAAKTKTALEFLKTKFQNREIEKFYICLTETQPPLGVQNALAGKHPRSAKRVLIEKNPTSHASNLTPIQTEILSAQKQNSGLYLIKIKLITGYRHQIRAHLAFLGHPIVGDKIYGNKKAERLMLHAETLRFHNQNGELKQGLSEINFSDRRYQQNSSARLSL